MLEQSIEESRRKTETEVILGSYMATDLIPSSLAALNTLTAISPLFATKIFLIFFEGTTFPVGFELTVPWDLCW